MDMKDTIKRASERFDELQSQKYKKDAEKIKEIDKMFLDLYKSQIDNIELSVDAIKIVKI